MGLFTKFLGLFKYDPETDREKTFNIKKALNDNWDKIDSKVKGIQENKADKVEGKQLSTEDYTTEEKQKLDRIEAGATKYKHPSKHPANMITQDSTHRFVTDTEESTWNNKETPAGAQSKANTAETNAKNYADSIKPTKVSQLSNDRGYITAQRAVSNSVTSTSTTTAGSSKAVKTAYDKGVNAYNLANTKESKITKNTGFNLNKSDSVTSTSTSTLATSKAVKTAYDKGASAYSNVTSATYLRDKIKTVDGSGSGIDADTVDGKHASEFQTNTKVHGSNEISITLEPAQIVTKNISFGGSYKNAIVTLADHNCEERNMIVTSSSGHIKGLYTNHVVSSSNMSNLIVSDNGTVCPDKEITLGINTTGLVITLKNIYESRNYYLHYDLTWEVW